jgi:hypothetical protein
MTDFKNGSVNDEFQSRLRKLGNADIVIGIPTYNNEATISNILKNCGEGLKKFYPELKSVILNADSDSEDRTISTIQKTMLPKGIECISTKYSGSKGKGSAVREILEGARLLDAKVCVIYEADTLSVTPEWIYNMVNPVLKLGYGFVAPYYIRNEHDATINNTLAYPLTRALYGLRIRQPIGGDFSFSNGVLQVFTRKKYWDEYPYIDKYGVDIWMATTALNEGFRVCQSVLGTKLHEQNPNRQIESIFIQEAGTIFDLMRNYEYRWRNVIGSIQGFIMGDFKFVEAERFKANYNELLEKFYDGQENYKNIWKAIFEDNTHREFKNALSLASPENITLSVELWTKIVYEFACAYNFVNPNERERILRAMLPFYYLRTATFIKEAELFSDEIADAVIEGNAGVFERVKWYLLDRWDFYKNKKIKINLNSK